MKNLLFIMAGAIFLFVSCQSDDLPFDEAAKSVNAKKVTKTMTIMSYEGIIDYIPEGGDCEVQFFQTGGGIASHIGQYTFENTACVGQFGPEGISGYFTAANGDKINYVLDSFKCDDEETPENVPCPDEYVTFRYDITGGTGRFDGADGWLYIYAIFVEGGPFEATGWAEITY